MMVGMSTSDYDVVVVGAGNGGLSAAALLKRRGCRDVALVEPSPVHVYKPLQNYVGVGLGEISELERFQADLIPAGVRWYQTSATRVDPANNSVQCADGTIVRGADLLLAPGARINWDAIPGALDGLQNGRVCTTYVLDQLARTSEMIASLRSGRAVFTLHGQPASGRETALKPLFLACDSWRRRKVLDQIEVTLYMTPPSCTRCPPLPARYDDTLTVTGCRCGPKPRSEPLPAGTPSWFTAPPDQNGCPRISSTSSRPTLRPSSSPPPDSTPTEPTASLPSIRQPFGIAPFDASGRSEMPAISAMPAPAAGCDLK
jgi:hypothetical protein